MSADPHIQAPTDTQSLNRYSYVLNNPMSATDPSGYFFKKFVKKWGRSIIGAVAAFYTFGAASAWALNAYGSSCAVACSLATASLIQGAAGSIAAGFVGGAINSGTLKGATKGAFTGAISAGINSFGLNDFVDVANTARNANATLVGTSTGKTGGNFANGADTEAFSRAFNGERHKGKTFSSRAKIYRSMQEILDSADIDTVWFGVAADLNEEFASKSLFVPDLLNDLGIDLLKHNINTFNELLNGKISLTGMALDNFLVVREQLFSQAFIVNKYGIGGPSGLINGYINASFVGDGLFTSNIISNGVGYVSAKFGNFNFWDTYHRIALGQAMMSQRRHGVE